MPPKKGGKGESKEVELLRAELAEKQREVDNLNARVQQLEKQYKLNPTKPAKFAERENSLKEREEALQKRMFDLDLREARLAQRLRTIGDGPAEEESGVAQWVSEWDGDDWEDCPLDSDLRSRLDSALAAQQEGGKPEPAGEEPHRVIHYDGMEEVEAEADLRTMKEGAGEEDDEEAAESKQQGAGGAEEAEEELEDECEAELKALKQAQLEEYKRQSGHGVSKKGLVQRKS